MNKRLTRTTGMIGATAALAVVSLFTSAGTAWAIVDTIRQGSDSSTWDRSAHKFTVCDNESDGHQVYVYFEKVQGQTSSPVYDPDSYGGGCGGGTLTSSPSNQWDKWILCEDIPFWPDDCTYGGLSWA